MRGVRELVSDGQLASPLRPEPRPAAPRLQLFGPARKSAWHRRSGAVMREHLARVTSSEGPALYTKPTAADRARTITGSWAMDDSLDLTEKIPRTHDNDPSDEPRPITLPTPKLASEIAPLSASRAANGTRTGITALPPPVPARAKRWGTMPPLEDAPRATAQPPPIPARARRSTTIPPPIPASARRAPTAQRAVATIAPPPVISQPAIVIAPRVETLAPPSLVLAPAIEDRSPAIEAGGPPRILPPLPTVSAAWLRSTRTPTPPPPDSIDVVIDEPVVDAREEETEFFDRSEPPANRRNVAAIAGIAVGAIAIAVVLGLGLRGLRTPASDKPAPAPAQAASTPTEAAPAAIPTPQAAIAPSPDPSPAEPTEPEVVTEPVPALIEPARAELATLPITSVPAGAIVTLIDDGNATVVGRTPVTASIDPTRTYDVVVALSGHATKIQHVDPSTTHELAVDLAEPPAAEREPAPAPALAAPHPAPARHRKPRAPATPKPVTTARSPKPVTTAAADTTPAPTASGVLMVSAKPPCDIAIDGKPTQLVTPQRSIKLAAGTHSITLTNAPQKIKKTIAVIITAQRSTKLLQDFTQH
jgi:hypothetical protein